MLDGGPCSIMAVVGADSCGRDGARPFRREAVQLALAVPAKLGTEFGKIDEVLGTRRGKFETRLRRMTSVFSWRMRRD